MAVAAPEISVSERIPFSQAYLCPEAVEAAREVMASGWITTGPEVLAFEREFADWVGSPHAVAVASCTAAIEIALRAMHLPAMAKVLTSTMTFCGAVHAIVHAGLQPVLVDVNPETLMPDAETTAQAVRRSGPVDAMVVVHFAGYPAPVPEMAAAAGLPLSRVVEDAAHAVAAKVGEHMVGTVSAATCFSFYATKNLPIGEGGMITTADDELADEARCLRLHGMSRDAWRRYLPGASWRYDVDTDGLKANMTDIQAAIGRRQLARLDGWQRRREELARRYDAGLAAVKGIETPPWPGVGQHAWHLYVVRVGPSFPVSRDVLIKRLSEEGVDCSVHFIPVHQQAYYRRLLGGRNLHQFLVADAVFERIVSLPFFAQMTDEQVDRVCQTISQIGREK